MLKLYNKDLVDAAANVLQASFFPSKRTGRHGMLLSNMIHVFNQSLSSKVMHALDGQPVAVRLKGLVTLFILFCVCHFNYRIDLRLSSYIIIVNAILGIQL